METTEYNKSQFSSNDGSFNSLDGETEILQFVYADELPVFEINSLSASPIEIEPNETEEDDNTCIISCNVNINNSIPFNVTDDMISLNEINAQIEKSEHHSEINNLETIFEGVFLETPPKLKYQDEIMYRKKYTAEIIKTTGLISNSNKKPNTDN